MEFCDLEGKNRKKIKPNFHLKVSLSIIYYIGTWPPRTKNPPYYIIYTVCSCIFILGILLLSEIANLIVIWGNIPEMVAGATLLMTNSVHTYKLIVILYEQKRIQDLLDIAKGEDFNRYNIEYEDILTKYTRQGIVHHIAYQSLGGLAVLCWGFTPIADLIAGRSRRLPIEGWYPMNTTISPTFEILCFHQGLAIIVACFHNVAMDTFVTGLITVACCQLALLRRNIISINNNVKTVEYKDRQLQLSKYSCKSIKNGFNVVSETDTAYKQLRKCIKHGNIIFVFVREIQNIFGLVIFFQFLVNCIIICFIAFHISQMNVYIPEILIGMLMYLSCMIYQIFIYCWHGNELHLHSISVALAAYSNNWYDSTGRFKRSLLIIIMRAQKPLVLTAGNILSLSLDTFVKILRMSYSIFTVLQSSANN